MQATATLSPETFSIGDASRTLDIPSYTLRYWEKEFAFFFDTLRTKGNQRRYCDEDVNKFEQIHKMLKIDGYSIAGARRALKKGDDAAPMMKQTVTGQEVLERLSGLLHKDVLESLFLTPKVA